MMRRSLAVLGGGMVPYHEWHIHEPLLKDYEGWRILDNVKMTQFEAWVSDLGGVGRHLDPIIDDPRLTHQQRVCRLYRWALKELKMYIVKAHATKFNLGYKVIRNRFERYRYVTDPAMCDMMVRETQKYLRETCCPAYMRTDPRSPMSCQTLTNPMFHPDNCLVYDHWTQPEVMWYGDAKMHRYYHQQPAYASTYAKSDRYGDQQESRAFWRVPWLMFVLVAYTYLLMWSSAVFHTHKADDPLFEKYNKQFQMNMRQVIESEERMRRSRFNSSQLHYDWDLIMGKVVQKDGYFRWWSEMKHTHPGETRSPNPVTTKRFVAPAQE